MRVVSNTSPLNYLILIDEIQLLPELFAKILIPPAVSQELAHPDAPEEVRNWIAIPPAWLSVIAAPTAGEDTEIERLDPGETEAILLAEHVDADLLLLDDRKARELARARGLAITGLVGILDLAVERGFVDAHIAVERLRATTFRASDHLLAKLFR